MVVLSFDHVVTPMGRQIPIVVRLVNFNNLTKDGAVSGGGNYYTKVKDNFDDSVDLVKSSVDLGFDIGEFWNGYPRIATVPITAVGGTCASVLMFVGKSAVDVFMKGNEVTLKKGDASQLNMLNAEIITIGNEIIYGDVLNTNSRYISSILKNIGINCRFHLTVKDDKEDISSALKTAEQRSDLIFITGGLGPTDDDITIECASSALGLDVEFRSDIFENIKDMFKKRNEHC